MPVPLELQKELNKMKLEETKKKEIEIFKQRLIEREKNGEFFVN